MKKYFSLILSCCLTVLLLDSCGSYKRTAYLQDMDTLTTYQVAERPDSRIHSRDKLNISVTCPNPSLAAPFSKNASVANIDPEAIANGAQAVAVNDYTVDKDGFINFPVIGKIYVENVTLDELKKTIEQKIIDIHYIKEPVVTVEFLNFQITMLGEISTVGNYVITGDGVNILEALALARDLKPTANTKDVWIIRTENGQRKVYSINMRSKSLYDSPAFYLQQNDIIYAKPRKTRMDSDVTSVLSWIGIFTSLSSLLTTVLLYLNLRK